MVDLVDIFVLVVVLADADAVSVTCVLLVVDRNDVVVRCVLVVLGACVAPVLLAV